jgi:hypothetical protein
VSPNDSPSYLTWRISNGRNKVLLKLSKTNMLIFRHSTVKTKDPKRKEKKKGFSPECFHKKFVAVSTSNKTKKKRLAYLHCYAKEIPSATLAKRVFHLSLMHYKGRPKIVGQGYKRRHHAL